MCIMARVLLDNNFNRSSVSANNLHLFYCGSFFYVLLSDLFFFFFYEELGQRFWFFFYFFLSGVQIVLFIHLVIP